jgi:hypothetical protein
MGLGFRKKERPLVYFLRVFLRRKELKGATSHRWVYPWEKNRLSLMGVFSDSSGGERGHHPVSPSQRA